MFTVQNNQAVSFETITRTILERINPNCPILVSLDIDRTLADLEMSSHYIHASVNDAYRALATDTRFIVTLNTGRDLTTGSPVMRQLQHEYPCILLSGRLICTREGVQISPGAEVSQEMLGAIWRSFIQGDFAFLDVKHRDGATFYVRTSRGFADFYGHKKLPDWMNGMPMTFIDLDNCGEEYAWNNFKNSVPLRIEPAITHTSHPQLLKSINARDGLTTAQTVLNFVPELASDDISITPCPAKSIYGDMRNQIGSVQILRNMASINKGTGLLELARLLSVETSNIIHFGDSARAVDNDVIVKSVIPNATMVAVTSQQVANDVDFCIDQKIGLPTVLRCLHSTSIHSNRSALI